MASAMQPYGAVWRRAEQWSGSGVHTQCSGGFYRGGGEGKGWGRQRALLKEKALMDFGFSINGGRREKGCRLSVEEDNRGLEAPVVAQIRLCDGWLWQ
jgi:hypothetical protein